MESPHTFIFDGTPKAFLERLKKFGEYVARSSIPWLIITYADRLYRIDFYPHVKAAHRDGDPIMIAYRAWNQLTNPEYELEPVNTSEGLRLVNTPKDIPIQELGIIFELGFPTLDSKTPVVATLLNEVYQSHFDTLLNQFGAPIQTPQDELSEQAEGASKGPRENYQIATTAAHYGVTQKHLSQKPAADLMNTTDRTYRTYRDKGWLLSEQEFKRITGKTIAEYWKETSGR